MKKLIDSELKVINVGVDIFYRSLRDQGVRVVQIEWHPPAGGDSELARLLEKLG